MAGGVNFRPAPAPGLLDVDEGPSKWAQTWEILSPYVLGPANAVKGLMDADLNTLLYDTGPAGRQAVENAFDAAGFATAGSAVAPKPRGALTMGVKAYHGSPHDFDSFSLDKIGTGEGAQAYGHGLYFAENEAVGQGYRDALRRKGDKITFDGKPLERPRDFTEIQTKLEVDEDDWRVYKAVEEITSRQGDLPERLADIRNWYRSQPEMMAAIDRAEKRINLEANPGRMYEVNINADPDAFLDWDKPLSEQPEAVRKALQDYGVQTPEMEFSWNGYAGNIGIPTAGGARKLYAQFLDTGNGIKATVKGKDIGVFQSIEQARAAAEKSMTESGVIPQLLGSDAYAMVAGEYPGNIGARTKPEASSRLLEKGIPGIKYLDAGSRAAGDGSRNYVVFDDSLIEILRKYGLAGLLGGGTAAGAMMSEPQGEYQ